MKFTTLFITGSLATALLLPGSINAQKTVRVAANKQYNKASQFKRIMFGEHYRKEWGRSVVPAL